MPNTECWTHSCLVSHIASRIAKSVVPQERFIIVLSLYLPVYSNNCIFISKICWYPMKINVNLYYNFIECWKLKIVVVFKYSNFSWRLQLTRNFFSCYRIDKWRAQIDRRWFPCRYNIGNLLHVHIGRGCKSSRQASNSQKALHWQRIYKFITLQTNGWSSGTCRFRWNWWEYPHMWQYGFTES